MSNSASCPTKTHKDLPRARPVGSLCCGGEALLTLNMDKAVAVFDIPEA